MPPSQLKQLKASLHDHGVLGPQKSKKNRREISKDAQKRLQRNAALENIRERFNPFENKTSARPQKYAVVSNKEIKAPIGRPGVTRGMGEERRKDTLLKEVQSRNKVGGMLDRRFGENDPTLTPEERAAERFARQNERKMRKTSMFNLEDDSEEEMALTHGGRSLDFGSEAKDDYEEEENHQVLAQDVDDHDDRPRKRVRLEADSELDSEVESEEGLLPERRKSKNEVMKEVIAKSKFHKAERQAVKEDDDDLRMELDQGMSDMLEALRAQKPPQGSLPTPPRESEPHMDPARAAMLAGKSREDAEKEYEQNVRQMQLDARSKPSFRTKTEEEKAAEEAERLQELERKRVRRMKGEAESSEDEVDDGVEQEQVEEQDDAEVFGLNQPETYAPRPELDVEDEDDFVLDDELIASGSELEMASDEETEGEEADQEDDGDDEFINGLVLPTKTSTSRQKQTRSGNDLAFTYPYPETHDEFLDLLSGKDSSDVPTIVQRIRALHHKGLAEDNTEKLGKFAHVLLQHIVYMMDKIQDVSFEVVESLLRHLHSMAKSQPHEVTTAFRAHLTKVSDERPLRLTPGDLMILTGISTIFPTSDHFHPVVTPAMLTIARYLGQSQVQSRRDLGTGAYCCSLALQYQDVAKRYVPEVITYLVNTLAILSPTPLAKNGGLEDKSEEGQPLSIAVRLPEKILRISQKPSITKYPQKLSFRHLLPTADLPPTFSYTLLHNFIALTDSASNLWSSKSAHPSLIQPLISTLNHLSHHHHQLPQPLASHLTTTLHTLRTTQTTSLKTRTPLLLHTHRPLAIKSFYPQFDPLYNPTRHNDPDPDRRALSRLQAEHKKEKKGAMRELRKDANFLARQQLSDKKVRDDEYERKMKRVIGMVQGEEGMERKSYERERRKRRGD